MKKSIILLIVAIMALTGGANGNAANISWVSVVTDDVAGADAGFTDLVRGLGHNVTRFFSHTNLTPSEVDTLNSSDLIIVGRAVNSGEFDGANATLWNTQITAPVIAMSGYITRQNRLGWFVGSTIPDSLNTPLVATDPTHPIFAGVELQADGVTMVGDYNVAIDRGASTPGDLPVTGGVAIATNPTLGLGVAIAEWPAGTTVTDETGAAMVLAGNRYFFAGGSREANGSTVSTAGKYDLTIDGLVLFNNTINYALGVPEPSTGIISLVGGVAVFFSRRRRQV